MEGKIEGLKEYYNYPSDGELPPLGLGPFGYAKKGRVVRLSRRSSGHGGCSVPMNR